MNLQNKRDNFLRPLSAKLIAIGVRPLTVSIFGVLMMIVSAALLYHQYFLLSVVFLLLSIASDFIDGSLARYQKSESDTGRIIDIVADNLSFSIFMIGLIVSKLIGAHIGSFLVCITILMAALHTHRAFQEAKKKHIAPKDLHGYWLMPNTAKVTMYIALGVFLVSGFNGMGLCATVLVILFVCSIFMRVR